MTTPLATTSAGKPLNAYVVLAIGILAVSTAAIIIRFAQDEGVPSILIAASRLMIAALALSPVTMRRYRLQLQNLSRRDILLAVLSGIFLAAHFATWVTSLEYTSVLISVVLVTTSPIWVALLEVFILRAQLNKLIIIGLIVVISGGIVIGLAGQSHNNGGEEQSQLTGAFLSLAGAVTVSVYLIIGRKLRAQLPVIPYIWLVYGCAAITLLVIVILTGTPIIGYSPISYIWLLGLGFIPQLIGHSSLNYALGYLPATVVSVATQIEPISSALLALIIFREMPAPLQIVGSLMILVGVTLTTLGQSQKL